MAYCDGTFEPKPTAPENWIITPANLYNGQNLDIFAGVYAASELRNKTQPGTQNQEYTARKNQWLDYLGKLIQKPQTQNTAIIDLGLVPDLCHNGRPPDPAIPSITPEGLINGSVGLAVAELVKQQYFDQWCECRPRDWTGETCPCQEYDVHFQGYQRGKLVPGYAGVTTIPGRLSGTMTRIVDQFGSPAIETYMLYGIGCDLGPPPTPRELSLSIYADYYHWETRIEKVEKTKGSPVVDCHPKPPQPDPPIYDYGLPGGVPIAIPDPLPDGDITTWDLPIMFFPVSCPPPKPADYMYWSINNVGASQIFSDVPPLSGIVVYGTVDTVDFDLSYDVTNALSDSALRVWRRGITPIAIDTTFVNVCNVYLMIDGVAIGDGIEMNVPKMRIRVPIEYRDRQKSIKIMPKGTITPITVADSGNRWLVKKFPST